MMLVAAILVAIVIVFIVYANRFELTRSDESIDVDAMMREETPVEEQITTQGVAAQGQKKERPLAKEVEKPQGMVVGATPSQEQAVPLPFEAEPGESESPSFKKSKPVTVAKTAESLVESSDEFERKESVGTSPGEEKLDVAIAATPSQEQAVPLPSEAGPSESDSSSFKKSKPVTVAKTAESLVESSDEFERKESADTLSALLHRFVSSYETGNLDQFMTLFAEDAQTNKRRNRDEIRTDYDDLFQTTDRRRLKLIDINWEPGNHAVQGWGRFEVKVRKKGKPEVTTYIGGLRFRVEKPGPQLRITHLYHTQTKVNVTVSDVE
jgi:hypothetical protein